MKRFLSFFAVIVMLFSFTTGCVTTSTNVPRAATHEVFGMMTGYSSTYLRHQITYMVEKGQTELKIFIMSTGGIAYDWMATVDLISYAQSLGIHVTTEAFGCVMSAAVPVFLAGDTRIAGPNTQFMVHHIQIPEGYTLTEDDIECVDMLEYMYTKYVADHSDLSFDEVDKYQDDVTFFTAKQAKRWGMVDRIIE